MNNTTLRSWLKDNSISALVIVGLTILFGILLGELQSFLGWGKLLLSLLCVFAIIFFVLWLSFKNVLFVNQQIASRIEDSYSKLIDKYKLGWVLSSEQLLDFEKDLSNIEIWLISADLREDKAGGFFQECVSKNLDKGNVIYQYFLPDKLDVKTKVTQLQDMNKNNANLKFTYLSDEFFFLVPRFDFAIYNPLRKNKTVDRVAFMGIPDSENLNQYHAKISDDFIDVLSGKLLDIISDRD